MQSPPGVVFGHDLALDPHRQQQLIEIDNAFCRAQIALQGAQILKYQIKSATVPPAETLALLWQAPTRVANKAIRGGIPLCFPWFGAHPQQADYPAHGFARNNIWHLEQIIFSQQEGHVLQFSLHDTPETRKLWNHRFALHLRISCGPSLKLQLTVSNTDRQRFSYHFAWHSYFAVSDIADVQIEGLQQASFIDQLTAQQCAAEHRPINISQEVDRIYPHASGNYHITDATTQLCLESPQAKSAVLWNPWQAKSQRLGDIGAQGWRQFVCVECGHLAEPLCLNAGQSQQFELHLSKTARFSGP
jgi:glucose-6-phosphate 1-epimerase